MIFLFASFYISFLLFSLLFFFRSLYSFSSNISVVFLYFCSLALSLCVSQVSSPPPPSQAPLCIPPQPHPSSGPEGRRVPTWR